MPVAVLATIACESVKASFRFVEVRIEIQLFVLEMWAFEIDNLSGPSKNLHIVIPISWAVSSL